MAVAAETIRETYARSLSTIRNVGRVALCDQPTLETLESVLEPARMDFMTAVTEMLKTDPEFREKLDIDNLETFPIVDGQVRGTGGRPMVDIICDGKTASEQRARFQPGFKAQAVRDALDLGIAERVDSLPVGTTLFALSMDPKEAMRQYPEIYKDELGYKEGLTYWQFYCRVDANTMRTGSFSVDRSNIEACRQLLSECNITIPDGESTDTWLNHTAMQRQASPAEAEQFVRGLRQKYYERIGAPARRLSVTEYAKANQHTTDTIFNTYYPALGRAVYSGQNNEMLKTLALTMLQGDVSNLSVEARSRLIRIGSSNSFDEESGRLMDAVLRYVATEQLRKGLKKQTESPVQFKSLPLMIEPFEAALPVNPAQLHQVLATNLQAGTLAGRTYGGCPGNIKLHASNGIDSLSAVDRLPSLQQAYGGRTAEEESEDAESGACEYSGTFCYCCPYNDDGTQAPRPYEVTIKRDKQGVAVCKRPKCGATMSGDTVTDPGGIYRKAMELLHQSQVHSKLAE